MAESPLQFRQRDQAAALRELARRDRPRAPTVAIASGKGGVGKSTIAVNLSICLAARGLRVTLVDVDMGLANADLLMDLRPAYSLSHVISGTRTVEEVCTQGPGGVRFVPGASGLRELADLTVWQRGQLLSQLAGLETSADIIVLDCGAGIGGNVVTFALSADQVMIVTTPQPPALTDAYATIKALHRAESTAERCLFVNMSNSGREAGEVYTRIAGVARRFLGSSVASGGYMLRDPAVDAAVNQRCPFVIGYPDCVAAACLASAADHLARRMLGERASGSNGRESFFSKVAGLFM